MSEASEVLALRVLRERAEALLAAGTLAFPEGETVAYTFVVPVDVRDDLADALADIDAAEDP